MKTLDYTDEGITYMPVVRRIAFPISHFGLASRKFDNLANMTKRERKSLFKKLRNTLVAFGVVDAKDTLFSIAAGMDAAGDYNIEVTFMGVRRDENT